MKPLISATELASDLYDCINGELTTNGTIIVNEIFETLHQFKRDFDGLQEHLEHFLEEFAWESDFYRFCLYLTV